MKLALQRHHKFYPISKATFCTKPTEEPKKEGEGKSDEDDTNKTSWQKFWDKEYKKRDEAQAKKKEGKARIDRDMERSQLQDNWDVAKKRGKAYSSILEMSPASKAIFFPPLSVESLDDTTFDLRDRFEGQVTIVHMYGSAMAMKMGEDWKEAFSVLQNGTQLYEVSINESWMARMLRGITKYNLKKAVPRENHANFCNFYGTLERGKLDMVNKVTVYTFLIDKRGKIRWKSSGLPDADELDLLYDFTNTLLAEK